MSFQHQRSKHFDFFLSALGRAGGDHSLAYQLANEFPDGAIAGAAVLKAQGLHETGSPGGELGALKLINHAFLDPVMERAVIGQVGTAIPGRTRLFGPGSGVTSAWTAEGGATQVSELHLDEQAVEPHKVTAMLVATNQLLESTSPEAVALLGAELSSETIRTMNMAYLDPNSSGVPGIMPPSITYGAASVMASGDFNDDSGIAALRNDIRKLFNAFSGSWARAALIMSTRAAVSLGLSRVLADLPDFLPVIVGDVADDSASPAGDLIVLVDRGALRYVKPEVTFSASRHGDLVVAGAGPDVTVPTAKSVTSLFATSSTAIKAELTVGWSLPPAGSVCVLSGLPRE